MHITVFVVAADRWWTRLGSYLVAQDWKNRVGANQALQAESGLSFSQRADIVVIVSVV
jgi:hypothetical protein